MQHQQPGRLSHIKDHILSCATFKNSQNSAIGRKPAKAAKLNFFKERFSVLQKNIYDDFKRKNREAVAITLEKPDINIQTDSEKYLSILNF